VRAFLFNAAGARKVAWASVNLILEKLSCYLAAMSPLRFSQKAALVRFGSCDTCAAMSTGGAQLYENEGGPFEFGNQVLISSHRKLLRLNTVVVSVAETPDDDPGRHGRERRAQANRRRSVESGLGDVRTGG
jgi:hypothetical protein